MEDRHAAAPTMIAHAATADTREEPDGMTIPRLLGQSRVITEARTRRLHNNTIRTARTIVSR